MLGQSNLNVKKYSVNTATGKLTSLVLNDDTEMIGSYGEVLTVTENGEYNEGPYSEVDVDVSSGGSGLTLYCWGKGEGEDEHLHVYTKTLNTGDNVTVLWAEEDASGINGNIEKYSTTIVMFKIKENLGELVLEEWHVAKPGVHLYATYTRHSDGDITIS